MSQQTPLAIVAGAGPGLGKAICEKFLADGFRVVGLNRTKHDKLPEGVELLEVDLSDPAAVIDVFHYIDDHYGLPKVLIHNPSAYLHSPFLTTRPEQFEKIWQSTTLSAALLSQQAINRMLRNDGGTIILSGATASVKAASEHTAFASAKFALRGLAQSLAREFQNSGIHIVHVVLDGVILSDKTKATTELSEAQMMLPEDIAETYLYLAKQARTTWTLELDLRPINEQF